MLMGQPQEMIVMAQPHWEMMVTAQLQGMMR